MPKKGNIPWNKGLKTGLAPWRGKIRSEETKRRISIANKGKSRNKGKVVSKEIREKIRQSLLGRKQSEETKSKRSLALKGIRTYRQLPLKTRKIISNKLKGSNGPNWKGGLLELQKQIRKSFEYREWYKAILKRDYYKCIDCNSNKKLNIHHVQLLSNIIEQFNIKTLKDALKCKKIWDVKNGITLCSKCHYNKYHKDLNFKS